MNKSNIINKLGLNKSAEKSNDALIDFWCKTGSFKNYCKIFYHIDSDIPDEQKMLEDLLANGKNEIYDTKSLVGYIELAVQYWEHQKMFMWRNIQNKCQTCKIYDKRVTNLLELIIEDKKR